MINMEHGFCKRRGMVRRGIALALIAVMVLTLWPQSVSATEQTIETFTVRDGKTVQGKIYLPDQTGGPYPTVVLAHGFGNTYYIMESYAAHLAENGFLAVACNLRADGEGNQNATVLTEAETLEAVINTIKTRADVDADNLFLMGMSQGGFVATHVAAKRNDIKGLVLLCPAFVLQRDAWESSKDLFPGITFDPYTYDPVALKIGDVTFPDSMAIHNNGMGATVSGQYMKDALQYNIYSEMKTYQDPVLIFHGSNDTIVPLVFAEKAAEKGVGFPQAKLITLSGQGHMLNSGTITGATENPSPASFFRQYVTVPDAPALPTRKPAINVVAYAPDRKDALDSVPIPDRADEAAYVIGASKVFRKVTEKEISDDAEMLFYAEFSEALGEDHYLFDVQIGSAHYGYFCQKNDADHVCWTLDRDSGIYSTDGKTWVSEDSGLGDDLGSASATLRIYASADEITAENAGRLSGRHLLSETVLDFQGGENPCRAYPATVVKTGTPSMITKRTQGSRRLRAASQGQPSCYEELTVDLKNAAERAVLTFGKDNGAAECKLYTARTYDPYRLESTKSGNEVSVTLDADRWVAVRWFAATGNADYCNYGESQIGDTEYYFVHVINPKVKDTGVGGGGTSGSGGGSGGAGGSGTSGGGGGTSGGGTSGGGGGGSGGSGGASGGGASESAAKDDKKDEAKTDPAQEEPAGEGDEKHEGEDPADVPAPADPSDNIPVNPAEELKPAEVAEALLEKYGETFLDASGTTVTLVSDEHGHYTVTVNDPVLGEVTQNSPAVFVAGEVYRLYNPHTGEHFYTKNPEERTALTALGWNYETGQNTFAIRMDDDDARPVYRVYNPNSGLHHYTTDLIEAKFLKDIGWSYEGISMYAYDRSSTRGRDTYRIYCPFPDAQGNNQHVYTTNMVERDYLLAIGYRDEGVCWKTK